MPAKERTAKHYVGERINVGPWMFVQTVKVEKLADGKFGVVPIADTFAVPGRVNVKIDKIRAWAKEQGYRVTYAV